MDGADQLDRNVLEMVPPEAILPGPPVHLLAARTEAGQNRQMRRLEAWTAVDHLEGTRGYEQIAVEVLTQDPEEAVERLDVSRLQQRPEVVGTGVCGVLEILGTDDLAVLEIGDEHRLDQQRLSSTRGQAGTAEQAMGLREVAEEKPVHALFRLEMVGMVLPETARFGAVDEVLELERVGDGVQFVNEAGSDGVVVVAGTRDASQREDADRVTGNDDEQAGEALVPERRVERSHAGRLVLVHGEDDHGREVLDAEDRRGTQVVDSRAQRASVRHVPDVVRLLVEFRRPAGGKTQAVLPRGAEWFRRDGLHHGCPGAAQSSMSRRLRDRLLRQQRVPHHRRSSRACLVHRDVRKLL